MANTTAENTLARSAFRAIAARYAQNFNMNPSVKGFCQAMLMSTGIDHYVKFMDHTPFMNNFNLAGAIKTGSCAVCGFTSPKLTNKYDREMYINRQYANSSTVIHEMLHFLTHPQFWSYVSAPITEAVTEYFTRKVISNASDANFDISQRKGRYDSHHTMLQLGRSGIKMTGIQPSKGYMKRAYFEGDQKAIAFIIQNFQDMEAMLALEDQK